MATDYVPRDEAVRRAGGVWQAVSAVIAEPRLTNGQARVLVALLDMDGPNLRRRPGRGMLQGRCGIRSERAVGRILKSLIDDGWISTIEHHKRRTWGYSLPARTGTKVAGSLPNSTGTKVAGSLWAGRRRTGTKVAGSPKARTGHFSAGSTGTKLPPDSNPLQDTSPDVAVPDVHLSNQKPNSRNDNTGLQPSSENQHGEKNRTTGGTAKLNPDPAALVAQARADAEADGGDTRLVAGLSKILGAGDLNRATWCTIDRLAIGQHCIRGDRESVTSMLLDLARGAVLDGADNPAAAFTARIRCMPAMARAWGAAKARAPT